MPSFWDILPWLLSACTVITIELAGRKDYRAWYVGLLGQVLWTIFDVYTQSWGLIPLTVILTYQYVRNLIVWRREARGS